MCDKLGCPSSGTSLLLLLFETGSPTGLAPSSQARLVHRDGELPLSASQALELSACSHVLIVLTWMDSEGKT